MRRSFVRLVVSSVLASWLVGFLVVLIYVRSQSWLDERAEGDGVFLAHELLDQVPADGRPARLDALRRHFGVALSLQSPDEVAARVGRRPAPGERMPYRESAREEWYFLAFKDGSGVLAAGPVDPALPRGAVPVGAILMLVLLPVIAGWLVLRVERQLSGVERATAALGTGELSARAKTEPGATNELAARFNDMAERVEQLVRGRDELVQAVSHELGSPLSRLRFHLELLGNGSEAQREERRAAMTRELDALDDLVAELLTYVCLTYAQHDGLVVARQRFDPSRTLHDLAELAQLDAPEERAIKIDVTVPGGASVMADPRLFQRAVENVLRNALRYAGGRVRVECTEGDAHVEVAVHDDGPGIPDAVRNKIMAPFFRLEPDRDRRLGGVGLGLAIVSRIVQRHGGRVVIATSPLGGAMVATVWPRNG
jgi:signal transduction histidine kinase